MADPSSSDLIALLARYAADGVLEPPEVLAAIGALAGEQDAPDPGIAGLLDVLEHPRDRASTPAIDALVGHVKQQRLAAAARFHAQGLSGSIDRAAFATLLGDLPLETPTRWRTGDPSQAALDSAIAIARDWRFISSRRDEAPETAAELERQYRTAADEAFAALEHRQRPLTRALIGELKRQAGRDRMLASQVGLDAALDQLLQRADGQPEPASQPEADRDDESATPLSLEEQFGQASTRDEQRRILDRLCLWPTATSAEVILRLAADTEWVRERSELVLTCRFGSPPVTGWTGWENFLRRGMRRRQEDLQQLVREEPGELLLIWAAHGSHVDPDVVAALESWCETHTTRVDAEAFVERRAGIVPAAEWNTLLGVEIEIVEHDEAAVPAAETVDMVKPASETAPRPGVSAIRKPVPARPPPPPRPSFWAEHVQPLLAENWYMVAGIVLVVAGLSLLAVFTWDKAPVVRFTIMPALLAGFTFALAAAGSWIERQDTKFRGTAAVLRGAAIALLPINFMVVALADEKVSAFFIVAMGLGYLALFGWGLWSWCRAVSEPLGGRLGMTLLAITSLVMIGPLAETLAGQDLAVRKVLIAIGFHAGFALVAWVTVWFAGDMLTRDMTAEKRVPWFVSGTLVVVFLQVFGWVHIDLGDLPHVSTYALLVVLAGWLVLYVERRGIELRGTGEKLGGESFLGYALVLLGVLMGTANDHVRIAAFALAGVVWLYQAVRRNHELQHWIGLTFLALAGASVALIEGFPLDPWLPMLGLLLALAVGGIDRLAGRLGHPPLARAAIGMQSTITMLTVVIAMLAQSHFGSKPLITAGYLLAAVAMFAWRAWRDDELRWVHTAMAVVGLSLPYLGCVDMRQGVNLHGNTMVFGLAVVAGGWLVLVELTRVRLLLQARSTVLWVYGSIAVAAMVLRVLFEDVSNTSPDPWRQGMDYLGPLLMAAVLTITTYRSRSLVPAAMAAVIAVILFPELRGKLEDLSGISWGSGIGSSISALGLVLGCFALKPAGWLKQLDEGDRFLGRIPFPFRRHDHTLFTWPLAASALFLIARVDTWDIIRNALPGHDIARLALFDLSHIGPRTALAVGLTGVTWTLLAVLFRTRRDAVAGTHLGWISLLGGLALGYRIIADDPGWAAFHPHWWWPFLATGLVLQGLDVAYRRLQPAHEWIGELLAEPTRQVLRSGSLALAIVSIAVLVARGEQEPLQQLPLLVFIAAQLTWHALSTRQLVHGSFLFVLAWVCLLSLTTPGETALPYRVSMAESLGPTLWLLLGIHAAHVGLEFARSIHERLRPLLDPFLVAATLLTAVLAMVSTIDTVTTLDEIPPTQRWLLLAATLAAARIHGSAWLGSLALLQGYLLVHAGRLQSGNAVENLELLFEPWRCAALALAAAGLGQAGRLITRERPGVLRGPFAQAGFRSSSVSWLFAPAVGLAVFAAGYHLLDPQLRGQAQQLWAPFLGAGSLAIVAYSCRSQSLAWLAAAMLALGNIHVVRHFQGQRLESIGLSFIHINSLGLVLTLVQLTGIRIVWQRERVAAFVNRANLALAGLVLTLICVNYITDPGLDKIPWGRFLVSGAMAYVAGLYFRAAARQPGVGEEPLAEACEAGYHFGVTLAIWCAVMCGLSIPEHLGLTTARLLTPITASYALFVPVLYFYGRAEQGLARGFAYVSRYRNSATVLSFAFLGLWLFRVAFHFVMFPDKPFDVFIYHGTAPLIMLLAVVMLRLHGLGGTSWLTFYGGLALMVGSFFTLTWIPMLRPLASPIAESHPIEAAWCAVALAHLWTLISHQRSRLRAAAQKIGRIDGPDWFQFRRSWGVCLLVATHLAVLWGLAESLGWGRFSPVELAAAPLLLGGASVLIHLAAVRRSPLYFYFALFEIVLALHAGFVVESYLEKDLAVWAILGVWAAGLAAWQLAPLWFPEKRLGTRSTVLVAITLAHVIYHVPDSPVGLWAFAAGAVLAALTPRYTRAARSVEETAAAATLLIVPTWLVYFSQVDLSGGLVDSLRTWPLLAALAAVFATGCLCRWFQASLLPGYDVWLRSRPRLFDQTLSLAGSSGASINSVVIWFCFAATAVFQLMHYGREFEPHELVLICTLYAAYSLAWFHEGRLRHTMSATIVLQLCVLAFFAVIRRQLMLTTEFWTPQYDVWTSLVVSFGLCGAKQVVDLQPREVRIPLIGTLLLLPVVALVWVIYNQMGSEVALLVVGLHALMFTFLGKDDRESPYHIAGVAGFIAFVLIYFYSQLELVYLHAYVIPVGLGVLVLLQLFRQQLDVETRNRIRLVTLLAMLGSAGWYALLESRDPGWFDVTLIALCLLAMGLGGFLRIRTYLLLGFAALLVDVSSIVFKFVREVDDQAIQRAAIGILLLLIGVGLVVGAIYYKTHRDRINRSIDLWRTRLDSWE